MTDGPLSPLDAQDPLPEANWLWRRVFVFLVTCAILWMVWGGIDRLAASAMLRPEQGIPALLTAVKWLIAMAGIMVTYYMIAPSAEQIVKMLQTAGLLKAGVQIAQRTVETPERKETAATVALPPQPVTPPVVIDDAPSLPDDIPATVGGDQGVSDETTSQTTRVPPPPPRG